MTFWFKRLGFAFGLLLFIFGPGCQRAPKGAPPPQKAPQIDLVWSASGEEQAFARFGSALAAGDVNGDGLPDLLVAAGSFNTGQAEAGKVYLYLGTPDGLAERPAWSASGSNREGAYFGSSISLADINRDGYADAIIGASNERGAEGPNTGKVYIYFGGPAGLASAPAWVSAGEGQAGAFFGISVSAAGDVNGDGFGDFLVGASGFADQGSPVGKAYLYLGGPNGPAPTPVWSSMGDRLKRSAYGLMVAPAGDVNHDGYDDILVAAPQLYGKVFLYEGSPSGPRAWSSWSAVGDRQGGSAFGMTMAVVGDINGDRFPDLLIGAPFEDTPGHTDAGRAFLFLGSPWGLSQSPWWKSAGDDQIDAKFGTAIAPVGDINQDGYADFVIGAKAMRTGKVQAGKAYLYFGSATGLSASPIWTSSGDDEENAFFGLSAAPMTSKAFSGFVVGAPQYSSGSERMGKVYLYRAKPSLP